MKPCEKFKMEVGLLALGSSRENDAAPLRAHLESCPGCRDYFRKMEALAAELKSAADFNSRIQTPAMFHANFKRRIESEARPGFFVDAFTFLRSHLFDWRFATPFAASLAVICLMIWTARRNQNANSPGVSREVSTAEVIVPTFGTYHSLAANSWDALDRELTREAADAPTSPRVLTAASISPSLFAE